jgi:hypothetical protein
MEPFYCLVHRAGEVPDLWLLTADTESEALDEIARREPEWRPFRKAELYQGERRIRIFAGPEDTLA